MQQLSLHDSDSVTGIHVYDKQRFLFWSETPEVQVQTHEMLTSMGKAGEVAKNHAARCNAYLQLGDNIGNSQRKFNVCRWLEKVLISSKFFICRTGLSFVRK